MKKNKSVIDIIFAEYNNFYEAEKKIADYIELVPYSLTVL